MKVSISFLGDISFNNDYIDLYKRNENPFRSLDDALKNKDFIIGNLECMAKGDNGENLAKKPRLTTTVETLNYLNQIPVNIVSLAQNHIYDHLEDGFNKTTQFLEENGIQYLGATKNSEEASKALILDKNDIKIGLLNYVSKDTNPSVPDSAGLKVNIFTLEKAISDIKEIKERVNHTVILLHWGGRVEGGLYPDWDQPAIARKLIDAGADLIIGHHPHTIQPFETYKGKHIFYSLGNFCFSDYTFEGKFNPMPERRMIMPIVNIEFSETNYSVDVKYFKNERTHFTAINYKNVMNRRNKIFKILKGNKLLWNFYFAYKQKALPFVLFFGRKDLSFRIKTQRIFTSFFNKINITKITDVLTGKTVEVFYKLYDKTQWFSESEMRKFQLNKFQKLITHCYNNVPFYTNYMNRKGFKPEDIKSLDDLKRFPIITKEIIKENYNDFLPKNNIKGTKISQTGGTTGNILFKRTDALSRSSIWGTFKRFRRWMNLKDRERGLILMGGHVIGKNYKDKFKQKINNFLTNTVAYSPYDTDEANIEAIINVLKKDNIRYIRSYPQFLFSLSKRLKKNGLTFNLKAITTTAEPILDEHRDLFREVFNCEVFDQYGCGEISGVAYECDKHEGLHVAEERVILETEGNNDLIMTDLDNYSLPYIRYYNADQAVFSNKKCSCGRQSPLIKQIMGRTCDYTTGINGEFLHWAYYWHLFFDSKVAKKYDLKKFQVVQENKNLLIIKLVCRALTKEEENKLATNIQERMGQIEIKFEYVDKIENTKTGKYRPVINKLIVK